jgi:hypothetical protein
MKKTLRFLSMAALVLMGAIMTGCTSSELENVQPVNTGKKVILTTTVSLADATKALTIDDVNHLGVKTFAAGETMAVIYKNTSGTTLKAVSKALQDNGDITNSGKSAVFTFELNDPDRTKDVTYIYPAAMAKADGTPNYDDLYTKQDGTLAKLASTFDYCTESGAWNAGNLPTLTLLNQLAICAFTLKDALGADDKTRNITNLTVTAGTNTYTVTRTAADGPIYVAIRPTSSATINYFATDGTTSYAKYVENKTYTAGNGYNISLKMAEVIKGKFTVNSSGKKVYFSKGNLQATTSNKGGTWTWHFAPNQYARVGNGTANTKINGNGTVESDGNDKNIDLFGWSTSTTHLGINNSIVNNDYRKGSITDGSDFVDWGSATEVTDCIGTGWSTLTSDEWRHLMSTRAGNRFALAQINGSRGGIILLPDDWKTSYYTLNNINNASVSFSVNDITSSNWTSKLEAHGAVFLPVTGQRNSGTTINGADEQLHYWSSSGGVNSSSVPIGFHMRFMPPGDPNAGLAPDAGAGRCNGFSVRLIYPVK